MYARRPAVDVYCLHSSGKEEQRESRKEGRGNGTIGGKGRRCETRV